MTTLDLEIQDIVRENSCRTKALLADYDPVTGIGAPGERAGLFIADYPIPSQNVPKEMLEVPLIKTFVNSYSHSIKGYLTQNREGMRLAKDGCTRDEIIKQVMMLRGKYDFPYWAYTQIHILDKEGGGLIPFKLNYAQIQAFIICEHLRNAGKPINVIICKARQWGGSTFCIFYQSWIGLKWNPSHCFSVCAQNKAVAASVAGMLSLAFTGAGNIKGYGAWDLGLTDGTELHLQPIPNTCEYEIRNQSNKRIRLNKIRIGSIENPDSLRGLPGSGAHFTEVSVWPDTPKSRPEDLVKAIGGGILPRPYTMQAIESTPKGVGNFFHRAYMAAKRGSSSFKAIFIPWFYISFDTLTIKNEKAFALWLYEHREDTEPNGKWKDAGKYYWHLWELGATLQGINWYRYKRLEYDNFADMASEAPSDDIEAFQNSGTKVFNIYDVNDLMKTCRPPKKRGILYSDTAKGEGVLDNIHFEESKEGEVCVWEMPDPTPMQDRYLVVVDVGGRSRTSDWSVIRVFDRYNMMFFGGVPEVVAQIRYHTDHDLLAYDAMRVAKWYNDALLVIESNTLETKDKNRDVDGNVTEYILDIIADLYDNLYAREASPESINAGEPTKWGFHTNTSTKPSIIQHLVTCVRKKLWIERDSYCGDELAIYEKEGGAYNAPPGAGNHDDVLMCTAIGLWICFREMDLPRFVDHKDQDTHRKQISSNTTAIF